MNRKHIHRGRPCALATAVILSGIVAPPLLDASTLVVDAAGGTPYQTIQSAISAAVPGQDDVLVRCGLYVENIVMQDQVSVTGENPNCTIVDGSASGTVVTMNGVDTGTVLQGFTIRNGSAARGGGIFVQSGSPVITRNVIRDNAAIDNGTFNSGYGGGIHVTSPAGLQSSGLTAPLITRNVIIFNTADHFGGGIEIYADDGTTVANNLFEENTAEDAGGAVDIYQSAPTLINNTIVRNCLQSGAPVACSLGGGGIAITNSGGVKTSNNVVSWNEALVGGGGVDVVTSAVGVQFEANDVWANVPANYAFDDGTSDPTGGSGNISTDPLFVDQLIGNLLSYQPRSDSPLVDGGLGNLATPPGVDLPGILRPLDGDAEGTAQVDIGVRENEGITRLKFDSGADLSWDAGAPPAPAAGYDYNLYRGDLASLRATGVYMQNPAVDPGARQWCAQALTTRSDVDLPVAGQVLFYLVVVADVVEGTLGFDSSPAQRPATPANQCP